ncbi:glycosyltransferase family 4 protein [Kocuria sp. CCUG 69068]|uniref:glycosyltransferase family 4 protein n=1 Tax=Kocuria sp. CCUG 69068 TaxID=2043138 RepID=UPI001E47CEF0
MVEYPENQDSGTGVKHNLLVLSPWGVAGGYSGPLVLQHRLMTALATTASFEITALYRERGLAPSPDWITVPVPVVSSPPQSFPQRTQITWLLRTSWYVLRNRRRFDAVFLQGAYLLTCLPALLLSKYTKVLALPVVDGGDLPKAGSTTKSRLKRRLQSRLFRRPTLGISLSSGIKNDLVGLGVREESAPLAYNLVNTGQYRPRPQEQLGGAGIFRMLFVGAVGRRKQPHIVIEACAELRNGGVDARVTLVGPFEDPAYEGELRALVSRLKLDSWVNFAGLSKSPLEYFQAASVFVLPSISEGMPGAMSEAMACGLPVVVSGVGAMPEVVDAARCGIVVPDFEVGSWVTKLQDLSSSPSRMREMSANGRKFAENHMAPDALASKVRRFLEG